MGLTGLANFLIPQHPSETPSIDFFNELVKSIEASDSKLESVVQNAWFGKEWNAESFPGCSFTSYL
jgi:hypothetical protein